MPKWKDASQVLPPYGAPLKIRWRGDRREYDATLELVDGYNAWMTEAPYHHPPDEWRLAEGASRGLFLIGLAKAVPFTGGGMIIGVIMLLFGGVGFIAGWLVLGFGLAMWLFTAWSYAAVETLAAKPNSRAGSLLISGLLTLIFVIPGLWLAWLILRMAFFGGPVPAIIFLLKELIS